MLWKRLFCSLTVLTCAVCLARPICAQIGGADLPDLSGLAGAIEKSTQSGAPPPKLAAPGAAYSSGLSVPSVHPGETAKDIVRLMREPIEKKSGPNAGLQKMEDIMPTLLTQIETYLPKQGLAKRDLGVAFGIFFVKNWETANHLTLSDPTEIKLVKAVSDRAAAKYKAKFATMTPAAKEKVYEQVLMSTILVSTLTDAFEKAHKGTEAAGFRKAAASMFTAVVGTAPDMIDISPDGKVTAPPPPPSVSGGTVPPVSDAPPATEAPPAETPPTDTPPLMEPGKPGAHALPSGHGLKPLQIAGVYAVQEVRIGIGGGFSQPFVPILALKDGTYTEDFDVPPSDLNLEDSRRRHASDWGHWWYNAASSIGQWDGSARHIQTLNKKGVWEATDWIGPLEGGKMGLRLSGVCKLTGGGGSAASGFSYGFEEVYTFFPDGHHQFGQSGGSFSNNETGSVAGSFQTKPLKHGTYAIANYGITLRGNDGTMKRLSYAGTAGGLVFMNGSAYTMEPQQAAASR